MQGPLRLFTTKSRLTLYARPLAWPTENTPSSSLKRSSKGLVTADTVKIMSEDMEALGAPKYILQAIEEPTVESLNHDPDS
jgi:hypothetical protein